MPTNKELEKSLKILSNTIQKLENELKVIDSKEQWAKSVFPFILKILLTIAAVGIAYGQYINTINQSRTSAIQKDLKEFEILKGITSIGENDTLSIDTNFSHFNSLDKDLLKRFFDNNIKILGDNYYSYKVCKGYLEHIGVLPFDYIQKITSECIQRGLYDDITYAGGNYLGSRRTAWLELISSSVLELPFKEHRNYILSNSYTLSTILSYYPIDLHTTSYLSEVSNRITGSKTSKTEKLIDYDTIITSEVSESIFKILFPKKKNDFPIGLYDAFEYVLIDSRKQQIKLGNNSTTKSLNYCVESYFDFIEWCESPSYLKENLDVLNGYLLLDSTFKRGMSTPIFGSYGSIDDSVYLNILESIERSVKRKVGRTEAFDSIKHAHKREKLSHTVSQF